MTRSKSAFVRCSPELAKRVKDEAAARDLGERFLVDRALTDLLDNLIPVDEFSLTRKRVLPEPLPTTVEGWERIVDGPRIEVEKSEDGTLHARCTACGVPIEIGNVHWNTDMAALIDLAALRHDCPILRGAPPVQPTQPWKDV